LVFGGASGRSPGCGLTAAGALQDGYGVDKYRSRDAEQPAPRKVKTNQENSTAFANTSPNLGQLAGKSTAEGRKADCGNSFARHLLVFVWLIFLSSVAPLEHHQPGDVITLPIIRLTLLILLLYRGALLA
jgi:hypothetical protein